MTHQAIERRRPGAFNVTLSANPLRAWRGAKLVLGNDSDYRVSHWVVYEDKVDTKAVQRRVFRNIEDHLNDGGSDIVNANVNAKRGWNMINAEHALDGEVCVNCTTLSHSTTDCCCYDYCYYYVGKPLASVISVSGVQGGGVWRGGCALDAILRYSSSIILGLNKKFE